VISADGWIAQYDSNGQASVQVDIVFREAHFGGEVSDKVRFSIKVRRAEIVLIVPAGEPIQVLKETVARIASMAVGETTTTNSRSSSIAGALGMDTASGLTASGGGAGARETKTETVVRESIGKFIVQHFSPDGSMGWEVKSPNSSALEGSPWDAATMPRYTVSRSAEKNKDGDRPTIRLEVRCRREDILIQGLEIKDSRKSTFFQKKRSKDANRAAAEQLIVEEIRKAGFLRLPNMSEPKSDLILADLILLEQTP